MKNEKQEQFLSVPFSVLERKDLNDGEKLTLMLIFSFHNNGKEFFMTNLNIGKRLGCSRTAASKRITKLEEMGCIKCNYIYTEGKKEVEKRIITPIKVVPEFNRVVPEFTTGSSCGNHQVVPEVGSIKELSLLDKRLDNLLDNEKKSISSLRGEICRSLNITSIQLESFIENNFSTFKNKELLEEFSTQIENYKKTISIV